MRKLGRYEDWKARQMRDPEFRAAVEELDPGFQVARLRIRQGLTQKELAKLVGTKQSGIARLESGRTEPSLSFLRRVVEALGGRLEVHIVAPEEVSVLEQASVSTVALDEAVGEEPMIIPPTESDFFEGMSCLFDWNAAASRTLTPEMMPA